MIIQTIYLMACSTLLIAAIYMIFAECYEDGIVGKLACGIIALGAFAALLHGLTEKVFFSPPDVAWMMTGVSVFIWRHLHRFWKWKRKTNAHS